MSFFRYLRTIRHVPKGTLLLRVKNQLVRRAAALPALRGRYGGKSMYDGNTPEPLRNELAKGRRRGQYLGNFEFRFLNELRVCKEDWFPEDASLLWLFHLHYFEYVFELSGPDEFEKLVRSWIEDVPPADFVAWHPYPLAKRISQWIWYYSYHYDAFDEEFENLFFVSLAAQLRYLSRHLEFHLGGNHLLENLAGLVVGALFFRDEELLRRGLSLYEKELAKQILPDGGHYERSPMYHALMLEDLFGVVASLTSAGKEVSAALFSVMKDMTDFLSKISLYGQLPLLNDSSCEGAPPVQDLFSAAKRLFDWRAPELPAQELLPDFGLFIDRQAPVSLVFDCGKIGPDELPGHAHNDQLSLLLWLGKREILTDSGVFTYGENEERQYFRSARAHNTVMLGGVEPNEIWKSFRVGRRGYPEDITWNEDAQTVGVSISCYQHLGAEVRREITFLPDGVGVLLKTFLELRRPLSILESFHFAEGIALQERRRRGEFFTFRLEKSGFEFFLVSRGGKAVEEGSSPFSPEFGIQRDRLCLRFSAPPTAGMVLFETVILVDADFERYF